MGAKRYGDAYVYSPVPCWTGALHAQPHQPCVRLEACCEFTSDYEAFFDDRGALDAPDTIPSGSVRAHDFVGAPGRLLIGHVRRDGWHS